ncbi:MAG: hypothetical protein EOM06_15520, partial [Sphingobacteriia bacterium]|nr:hypothetical protein [Sphingobacteriia bacterium]
MGPGRVNIDSCMINDYAGILDLKHGISINGYDEFTITNNHVEGFKGSGIRVWNSGDGASNTNLIENNAVINNGLWGDDEAGSFAGLDLLNTEAEIRHNQVKYN